VLFGDEAELVQAMDRLQSDRKHRQALAQSARRAFERHWSEAAVMAQYERLLHGLALAGGRTHLLQALGTLENA
jgi:glycosyltransferase involved in cell wall biosynthesis